MIVDVSSHAGIMILAETGRGKSWIPQGMRGTESLQCEQLLARCRMGRFPVFLQLICSGWNFSPRFVKMLAEVAHELDKPLS